MRYKHHIIPRHEWKKRFNSKVTRWDKEFNAPDNVVWLSLEQHIQVHWLLWELNGLKEDLIAYRTMSGQISSEEALRQVLLGNTHTKGHKRIFTEAHKKALSSPKTPEHRRKLALSRIGTKATEETKKKMSESAKRRPKESEETKKKKSEAVKLRPKDSEETKKKKSEAAKLLWTPEARAKRIANRELRKSIENPPPISIEAQPRQ